MFLRKIFQFPFLLVYTKYISSAFASRFCFSFTFKNFIRTSLAVAGEYLNLRSGPLGRVR